MPAKQTKTKRPKTKPKRTYPDMPKDAETLTKIVFDVTDYKALYRRP